MRHAAALGVGGAHGVAGRLGRDHPHVEVGARHDLAVVHVEAVRERQRRALLDVGLDVVLVDGGDLLVGQQDHDDVGGLHGVGDFGDLQAGLLGLGPGSAALAQADRDLDAAVVQVLRVRMALRAVADDGDVLALDQAQVGVLVVVNLHGILLREFNSSAGSGLRRAGCARRDRCRWCRCARFPEWRCGRWPRGRRRACLRRRSVRWCSSSRSRR